MNWYRYAIHGSFAGIDTMRNVFYLETASPITDHSGVIGELLNQFIYPLRTYIHEEVEFQGADVAEYFAGTGWGVNIFYSSVAVAGTGTDAPLPHQVAACITAYTLQKRVRGRKFISGLITTCQSDGTLNASPYTALQGVAAQWTAGISPAGQPAVNFRIWSESSGLFHSIRTATARSLLATMRTRKPGRGLG